jgi:Flp pilus assembly protein TadG
MVDIKGALPRAKRLLRGRGQSMIEFALLAPVFFLLIAGILQFGTIFRDYLLVQSAARDGARAAAAYLTASLPCQTPDRNQDQGVLNAVNQTLGSPPAANFNGLIQLTADTTATYGSYAYPNSTATSGYDDLIITYSPLPATSTNPCRSGDMVTVEVHYHTSVYLPLIGQFLPADSNKVDSGNWMRLVGKATMKIE